MPVSLRMIQTVFASVICTILLSVPADVAFARDQAATISANPNPVPRGVGLGSTTISWKIEPGVDGVVTVSVAGGPEEVFAQGAAGTADAPWIDPAKTYRFTLYADPARRKEVASLTVTSVGSAAARPPPFITAEPNPVSPGPAEGTRITWDTGRDTPATVQVTVDGGPPAHFASGASGSAVADWISINKTYEFRLVADENPGVVIASVVVTRHLPRVGQGTLFRIVGASVLLLLLAAVWRFFRDPEPPPLA